jgi:hypothetical protein
MAGFRNCNDYSRFEGEVKSTSRYFWKKESKDFLDAILKTSQTRRVRLEEGRTLWRAQLGGRDRRITESVDYALFLENGRPLARGRMKPTPKHHGEGRANPKGIPYLYLASDGDTAMAEMRPSINEPITLAKFRLSKDCTLVDFSRDEIPRTGRMDNLPQDTLEKVAWGIINYFFSAAIRPADQPIAYVPTQILAESFRHEGLDGIAYRSSVRPEGLNYALFCLDNAALVSTKLCELRSVCHKFGPYSL